MFKSILRKTIKGALWLLDSDHRHPERISDDDLQKFTHVVPVDFQSDFGKAVAAFRTVPYDVWELKTTSKKLLAADRHRVIREDGSCAWLEDLIVGDRLKTDNGIEEVLSCKPLGFKVHMYCLHIETDDIDDPNNHLFYTDGILSHNTTCSAAYLLWRAMFVADTTILITANTFNQALEIVQRVKYFYENIPDHIRCGVTEYNKASVSFDNGSRIISRATSPNAGRGLSISLLYCLAGETTVKIRDKETGEIQEVSLEELYGLLDDSDGNIS